MTVRSMAEARLLEDRERRQQYFNEKKLKKIKSEVNGKQTHLMDCANTVTISYRNRVGTGGTMRTKILKKYKLNYLKYLV